MKKTLVIGIGLLGVALMGSMCESNGGGGGGGGMFSVSGLTKSADTWDMFFALTTPACGKSFAEHGGSPLGLLPGGFYQGPVVVDNGGQFTANIPENFILGYQVVAPGAIMPGDAVAVHFRYQAAADGLGGDYFLSRIYDGNLFREQASAYMGSMTYNKPLESNYTYVSVSNNFGLQFMVGLHGPTDKFYLDDVLVMVNGTTLFEDKFEGGDYTTVTPLSPSVIRVPFIPAKMVGSIATQNNVVLEGASSLAITGGAYFQLYGQGGTSGTTTFAELTYTDPDALNPFYGQSQAALQSGVYMGDYRAWNQPVFNPADPTYCSETGQVLIGPNLIGDANLAGPWTLTLANVTCQEAVDGSSIVINDTITDIQVARMLNLFVTPPFGFGTAETSTMMFGLSMADFGFMELTPAMLGAPAQPSGAPSLPVNGAFGAQLIGVYYIDPPAGFPFLVTPGMRLFTGTVMGTIPAFASPTGYCTVTSGSFIAIFDDTVFVPPPPLMIP